MRPGRRSVWTIGRVTVEPGAPSIVPGFAEVAVQFRDQSDEVLQRMLDAVTSSAEELDGDESGLGGGLSRARHRSLPR